MSMHSISVEERSSAATGWSDSHALSAGNKSISVSLGNCSHAVAAGSQGYAISFGAFSHAVTTSFEGKSEARGKHSIAVSLGHQGVASASRGGAIFLVAYDPLNGAIAAVFASLVGENGIEPDVKYKLNTNGKVERVD